MLGWQAQFTPRSFSRPALARLHIFKKNVLSKKRISMLPPSRALLALRRSKYGTFP